MKELYVIYNSGVDLPNGGHPSDGGAGGIDREWDEAHRDGSTMSERIPKILAKDPDRAIIFLPNQELPDFEEYKIKDDQIVEMTEEDIQAVKASKPKSETELLKERVTVLENLIDC